MLHQQILVSIITQLNLVELAVLSPHGHKLGLTLLQKDRAIRRPIFHSNSYINHLGHPILSRARKGSSIPPKITTKWSCNIRGN